MVLAGLHGRAPFGVGARCIFPRASREIGVVSLVGVHDHRAGFRAEAATQNLGRTAHEKRAFGVSTRKEHFLAEHADWKLSGWRSGSGDSGSKRPAIVVKFTRPESVALAEESSAHAAAEVGGRRGEQSAMGALEQGSGKYLAKGEEDREWTQSPRRVAVIGAGVAGLVAARELVSEGHSVVIYEQQEEVGGLWKYDPTVESDLLGVDPNRSRVHSSMYASLRTNLSREVMGFLDFPFLPTHRKDRDDRRFPDHGEVANYLEDFAEEYDLHKLVEFGATVEYVGPQVLKGEDTRWTLRYGKSGAAKRKDRPSEMMRCPPNGTKIEVVFDAIVVCSGHFSVARIAHIPGIESWPGAQIHSHNYRVPDPFKDKVVVVIGSSNSADDISKDVALVASEVHRCARAWSSIESTTQGEGPQENLWRHPMVERASADLTVNFEDGSSAKPDIILHCTGYLYAVPFLDSKDIVSVEDNRVGPLYKHVFPPALAPTLSFVGLPQQVLSFPLVERQSRWIAKVLSRKINLPTQSEMMADVQDFYKQLEADGIRKSHTHYFQWQDKCAYIDWLAEQTDSRSTEDWRLEIFKGHFELRNENPYKYRDEWNDYHLLEKAVADMEKIKGQLSSAPRNCDVNLN